MSKDDFELFDRWSDGDVDAGQVLIRRHYDRVYVFFASKVPEPVAAALTQRTFEVMCVRADRLGRYTSMASFLLGIAREILLERLGRRVDRPFDPTTESIEEVDDGVTLTSVLIDKEHASRLVLALRRLPLDDQIMLELQTRPVLRLQEVAEILGVSNNRIATRIATAQRRLRRVVSPIPGGEDTLTILAHYLESLYAELVGRRDDGSPASVSPSSER
ncbi:MAG: hypothetical protein AAGF11_49255 [Myxococcota bacterium]